MQKIKILLGILASIICGSVLVLTCFSAIVSIESPLLNYAVVGWVLVGLSIIIPFTILFWILRYWKYEVKGVYFIIFLLSLGVMMFYVWRRSPSPPNQSYKAVAAVRQIASGLEIYHNEKKVYPAKLDELVPYYLGNIPNIVYKDRKVCPQDVAITSYKMVSVDDFILEFCMEKEAMTYGKGMHTLTVQGIK